MADYNLDSLIADLKKGSYKPKTEEELQGIAGRRYQTFYDQQRLGANQAAETTNLALNRQLANAGVDYGKQRESSLQNYQNAYSQADRQSLSRGMQRSTFNAATLGNVALAGNKAQQDITDSEQRFKTGIGDQQTLLAQQLAGQLRQYSASQAADTLSYIDELESREYERGDKARQDSNSLAAQIYQFANQEKAQDRAQQNWLDTFNQSNKHFDKTYDQTQGQIDQGQKNWDKTFDQTQGQINQAQENWGKSFDQTQGQINQAQENWGKSFDQSNEQFAEGIRQFDAQLTAQEKQSNQSQENWLKQFAQSAEQYDKSLAEQIRQYDTSLSLQEKQMAMSSDQFQQTFAENVRQFNEKNAPTGGGTTSKSSTTQAQSADDKELGKDKDLFLKNFVNITNKTANVVSGAINALKTAPKPKKVTPVTKTKYVTNQLK